MKKHVMQFLEFLEEGIKLTDDDQYSFDWINDDINDILPLKYRPYKGRILRKGDTTYSYYHAFQLKKTDYSTDLLKAIKMLEINRRDLDQFLSKAVLGFNKKFAINSFDTIISPTSSSLVLSEFVNMIADKGAIRNVYNDSFVKAAQDEIQLDLDKVNKIKDEKTKVEIFKAFKRATAPDNLFKMKDIWARYREYFINFLKFNTENDRRLYNAVTGKNIVLVDDFKTSGTTIREMLNQLSDLGAANVVVIVLIKVDSQNEKTKTKTKTKKL